MPEEVVTTPEATPTPEITPTPTPTPAPAGDAAGNWDRERRGLIAETQKERAARQRYETDLRSLQGQHAEAQKRIQALAGIGTHTDQQTQDEEIRRAFKEKFPEYADLTAEDVQALKEMRAQTAQLTASTNAMWKKHTNQVLGSINVKVAEKLGGAVADLSEKQKASLRREYIAYIEEGQQAGKDFVGRHEDADDTLLDEFVDSYLKEWQEPIRRSVTSTEVNRNRPLPSGKGRTIATTGTKKIDFSNNKEVENAAVEVFKNFGGNFG